MKDIISHFAPTSLDTLSLQKILKYHFTDAEVKYSPIYDNWKIVGTDFTHIIQFNSKKQSKLTTKGKTSTLEIIARIILLVILCLPFIFLVRSESINTDYIFFLMPALLVYDSLFNYLWNKIYPTYHNTLQDKHSIALAKMNTLKEDRIEFNLSALETE